MIFFYTISNYFTTISWKIILSPLNCLCTVVENQMCRSFSQLFILHSIHLFLHQNHTLLIAMALKVKVKLLSSVWLFATPWTVAYQAPHSMGFSRQEYWSGLPFPSPGHLSHPGIEPGSPTFQADALTSEPPGKPEKNYMTI